MATDAFDLERFVAAQARDYAQACRELRAGRKTSHWIWYVFPQLKGLGFSVRSEHYGIASLAEARAYLAHPLLGPRLGAATGLVLAHAGRLTLNQILGSPDDLKFRSSMTLFAAVGGPESIYRRAIELLCFGQEDERTLRLLASGA